MSWQIWDSNAGIGTGIIMPIPPEKATVKYSARVKEIVTPSGSIIMSYGTKGALMVWTGKLVSSGRTFTYLETNYLNYIESKVHSEVWIVAPQTRYDGSWIVKSFEHSEDKGIVNLLTYKLEFIKGIQSVIL